MTNDKAPFEETPQRRPWSTPKLRTMRAGSAEAGPNPNAPEGPIARGS